MNSFIDSFERILLVGEIGLVGLYTLGLYPGLVERSNKNVEEYAKLKDFMLEVFKKAANKKCRIILPTDFICAQKSVLEDVDTRLLSDCAPALEPAAGVVPALPPLDCKPAPKETRNSLLPARWELG